MKGKVKKLSAMILGMCLCALTLVGCGETAEVATSQSIESTGDETIEQTVSGETESTGSRESVVSEEIGTPTSSISATIIDSGTCGEDLRWTVDSTGTLTVSGTGEMDDYRNPEAFPSTSRPWEEDIKYIEEIIIEQGVTSIGECAFCNFTYLTSIIIPDSITQIGVAALGNSCLESVELPSSITEILDDTFMDCSDLTDITIPNSITYIGKRAFFGCENLTSITIPDSVTSIGNAAFENCTGLTEITIPDSVESIGDFTFIMCTNLKKITLSKNLNEIGISLFSRCYSLSEIYFKGDEPIFVSESEPDTTFFEVVATVYYPGNNPTWTSDFMQDYGGTITWEPY